MTEVFDSDGVFLKEKFEAEVHSLIGEVERRTREDINTEKGQGGGGKAGKKMAGKLKGQ